MKKIKTFCKVLFLFLFSYHHELCSQEEQNAMQEISIITLHDIKLILDINKDFCYNIIELCQLNRVDINLNKLLSIYTVTLEDLYSHTSFMEWANIKKKEIKTLFNQIRPDELLRIHNQAQQIIYDLIFYAIDSNQYKFPIIIRRNLAGLCKKSSSKKMMKEKVETLIILEILANFVELDEIKELRENLKKIYYNL